jgi:hypothetical protein
MENYFRKLEVVFRAIEEVRWGLGEFLYEVFRLKNEDGDQVRRSKRHAGMVQRFLQGNTRHTPAMIIDAWFRNPDGCISAGSAEDSLMYSTDTPYLEIQSIRAALTSFAAQIVEKKVVKEAQLAVHPTSGLHATMRRRATHQVEWADVGAATVPRVAGLIQKHQPLTWHLLMSIANPEARNKMSKQGLGELHVVRTRRPIETVSTSKFDGVRH